MLQWHPSLSLLKDSKVVFYPSEKESVAGLSASVLPGIVPAFPGKIAAFIECFQCQGRC